MNIRSKLFLSPLLLLVACSTKPLPKPLPISLLKIGLSSDSIARCVMSCSHERVDSFFSKEGLDHIIYHGTFLSGIHSSGDAIFSFDHGIDTAAGWRLTGSEATELTKRVSPVEFQNAVSLLRVMLGIPLDSVRSNSTITMVHWGKPHYARVSYIEWSEESQSLVLECEKEQFW